MSRRKSWLWCGSTAQLIALPAEPESVGAGHRSLARAVEAIAAGPVPIKTFLSFFVDFAGHSTAGVSHIDGMLGSVPRPVPAAVGGASFCIWQKDTQRSE